MSLSEQFAPLYSLTNHDVCPITNTAQSRMQETQSDLEPSMESITRSGVLFRRSGDPQHAPRLTHRVPSQVVQSTTQEILNCAADSNSSYDDSDGSEVSRLSPARDIIALELQDPFRVLFEAELTQSIVKSSPQVS